MDDLFNVEATEVEFGDAPTTEGFGDPEEARLESTANGGGGGYGR